MKFDIEVIKNIVLEAGKLFSDEKAASAVTEKGAADFVTAVDYASQNYIKEQLLHYFPDAALLSERTEKKEGLYLSLTMVGLEILLYIIFLVGFPLIFSNELLQSF